MLDSLRLRAVQAPIIPVVADLIRTHPGTISLGQGVVHYGPPSSAAAQIERFLADPTNHKYQPVAGLPALISALEQKHAQENQVRIGPAHGNRLMVTAGGNQAFLNALLAIADPGDEVILPTPYYFNHEMAVTMANCRAVHVPTDGNHQLDIAALGAAITPKTRAILTVSPNNPTGAVYPAAAIRAVNALCARHGIFHVHDEAYEYFTYDGAAHFSPAAITGAADHTITLHSLSKSHGFASWRVGWMVYPTALESALRKIQDTVIICPPAISQAAALGALAAGPTYVRAGVQSLANVRPQVLGALQPLVDDGLCRLPPANGAFYFFLRVHTSLRPLALVERLVREHRVAVIPGDAFGATAGCPLRVAYGALAPETVAEGIGRFAAGLRAIVS